MKAWYYWGARYDADGEQLPDVRCVIHAPTRGAAKMRIAEANPDLAWVEVPNPRRSPADDTGEP